MAFINFQPKDNFKTLLYTGNGSDGHSITGVGFKPDFVWTKNRGSATDNYVHDMVQVTKEFIHLALSHELNTYNREEQKDKNPMYKKTKFNLKSVIKNKTSLKFFKTIKQDIVDYKNKLEKM